MGDLKTRGLRNDDTLILILSGLGRGRYSRGSLKRFLFEVIDGERISVEGEESSRRGKIPSLLEGIYFGFERAWSSNVAYLRGIEPVGLRDEYLLNSEIGTTAEFLLEEGKVSQEDYDFLRKIGTKLGEIVRERTW